MDDSPALYSSEIQRFREFTASVVSIVQSEIMETSFTQLSDTVKDGRVSSNSEGIAKGRDGLDTSEGTPKENKTILTPAVQMLRLTNCEDDSELETVEIIALNSSGQELGNKTTGESYINLNLFSRRW